MTEQEELLMLSALAEKQKAELAAKDKTIESQKAQIEKQKIQIENMIQALLNARKKLFGPSSEVTSLVNGQMNLFETTMELVKELFKEQQKITVPLIPVLQDNLVSELKCCQDSQKKSKSLL